MFSLGEWQWVVKCTGSTVCHSEGRSSLWQGWAVPWCLVHSCQDSSLVRCPQQDPTHLQPSNAPSFVNLHHSQPHAQPRLSILKCSAWSCYSVLWSRIYCRWINVLISLDLDLQSQIYVYFWWWVYNLNSESHLLWVNLGPFFFMANERARKQNRMMLTVTRVEMGSQQEKPRFDTYLQMSSLYGHVFQLSFW